MRNERATTEPKFQDPHAIVCLKSLDQAFNIAMNPCPVSGCGKAIVSQSKAVHGSCVKFTFLCSKGHPTIWSSCEQIGRQILLVNKLVPAAAVMSGLKVTPMKRFLALLQIDSQNADYMKNSTLGLLVRLTNELWEEEVAVVRQLMMEDEEFDCGMHIVLLRFLCFIRFLCQSFHLIVCSSHRLLLVPFLFLSDGRAAFTITTEIWLCSLLHRHFPECARPDLPHALRRPRRRGYQQCRHESWQSGQKQGEGCALRGNAASGGAILRWWTETSTLLYRPVVRWPI